MANLSVLASDDNNPAFVGARNPDDLLHVRFYHHPLKNQFKSVQEGRPIFDTIVFIEIMTPGNQLNIIQRPKYPSDEKRFPRQWAHFANTHSDDPVKQGTPLDQWPLLDVGMVEMLKAMKFFTIEQIAFSSDAQIGTIGMLAGMAPLSFRDKAKAYLEVARDASIVSQKDEELKATKAKLAELEARIEAMSQAPQPVPPVPEKKKYVMTPEHKEKLRLAREAKKK